MTYSPDWIDAALLGPPQHRPRVAYMAQLCQAVNRRYLLSYQGPHDYSTALQADEYVSRTLTTGAQPPPFRALRQSLTGSILYPPPAGLGGQPPSPTAMHWLWPGSDADHGKPISAANPAPPGQVSLFDKLNGTDGYTDPFLHAGQTPIRAVHVNELRQVCEHLRMGLWEMPIYWHDGICSFAPDTPWYGDIVANDGADEVRILGYSILRTEEALPRGLVGVTMLPASWIDVRADEPCTLELYASIRPVGFVTNPPTWNHYDPAGGRSWTIAGGCSGADSVPMGSVQCVPDQWVRLSGPGVAAGLQGMADGGPQVFIARRADPSYEAVFVESQLGAVFELNGPPC